MHNILKCPKCEESFLNQNSSAPSCPHCAFHGQASDFEAIQAPLAQSRTSLPPSGRIAQTGGLPQRRTELSSEGGSSPKFLGDRIKRDIEDRSQQSKPKLASGGAVGAVGISTNATDVANPFGQDQRPERTKQQDQRGVTSEHLTETVYKKDWGDESSLEKATDSGEGRKYPEHFVDDVLSTAPSPPPQSSAPLAPLASPEAPTSAAPSAAHLEEMRRQDQVRTPKYPGQFGRAVIESSEEKELVEESRESEENEQNQLTEQEEIAGPPAMPASWLEEEEDSSETSDSYQETEEVSKDRWQAVQKTNESDLRSNGSIYTAPDQEAQESEEPAVDSEKSFSFSSSLKGIFNKPEEELETKEANWQEESPLSKQENLSSQWSDDNVGSGESHWSDQSQSSHSSYWDQESTEQSTELAPPSVSDSFPVQGSEGDEEKAGGKSFSTLLKLLWYGILAVGLGVVLLAVIADIKDRRKKAGQSNSVRPSATAELGEADSIKLRIYEAQEVLEKIFEAEAEDEEERIQLLADLNEMEDSLPEFFSQSESTDPIELTQVTFINRIVENGVESVSFRISTNKNQRGTGVTLVNKGDGFKMLWASFYQFHENTFEEFVESSAPGSQLFYVFAQKTHTFEGEIKLGKSIQLLNIRGSVGGIRKAYADEDDEKIKEALQKMDWNRPTPIVVRLENLVVASPASGYNSESPPESYLIISEIVSIGWGNGMLLK